MKRPTTAHFGTLDWLLLGTLVVSTLLLLQPSLVAYPDPGDCTNLCQMRSEFEKNTNGNGTSYSAPICEDCVGGGRCQWDTAIGANCQQNSGLFVARYSCTGCIPACTLVPPGVTSVEAALCGCTPENFTPYTFCN